MAMARFTKVYHTCLLAGLPMRETVASSAAASRSGTHPPGRSPPRKRHSNWAARWARSSSPAAPSRPPSPAPTPPPRKSGGLDKDLARWSLLYQEEASRATKALSMAVPKLFYALIVAFIVWKIISFWSGYYGMLEELSR